jgi:hypothetical protein
VYVIEKVTRVTWKIEPFTVTLTGVSDIIIRLSPTTTIDDFLTNLTASGKYIVRAWCDVNYNAISVGARLIRVAYDSA